jgi:hypothetical protein
MAELKSAARSFAQRHFQYDSWRTAMNWSVDWAWWATDVREPQRSDRLQAFFESKEISSCGKWESYLIR